MPWWGLGVPEIRRGGLEFSQKLTEIAVSQEKFLLFQGDLSPALKASYLTA